MVTMTSLRHWLVVVLFAMAMNVDRTNAHNTDDNHCFEATVSESCSTTAGVDADFFFCSDRYSWAWSNDSVQLPIHTSDSLCLAMDSDVIDGLDSTKLIVLGGCVSPSIRYFGPCPDLSTETKVFDPVEDKFTESEAMPNLRYRAAAVNVSNHIYMFGGRDLEDSLVCGVDRYDVVTETWTTLDSTQTENCFSDHWGVANDDNTIFLFGGWNANYEAQNTTVMVTINGDELSFSTTSPMMQKRGDHVCTRFLDTDDVYCMGGFFDDSTNSAGYTLLSSVEHFDMGTKVWSAKSPMVTGRADFALGVLNDRITVMGGEQENFGLMKDIEWYDPVADCWTDSGELFNLPFERLRYCGVNHDAAGRIYIFGGQILDDPNSGNFSLVDTVNWYQELLVTTLNTESGAPPRMSSLGAVVTVGVIAVSTLTALVLG